MVLEESSNSRDFFATDDAPPPDGPDSSTASTLRRFSADGSRIVIDASVASTQDELLLNYSVNGGPLRRYNLRFDRMPLQGFSRAAAFGNAPEASQTSYKLVDMMSKMDALNGRPLTQTEAEGLALHVSRRQLYPVAAFYGSIALGGLIAYGKRKTFKFPLRKPKPVEQYNSFPLQRVPLLSARYSRAAWHATRGLAYIGVSSVLMMPSCELLGRAAQNVHLMRDERTRAVVQEVGRSLQRARGGDPTNRNWRGVRRPQTGQGADQSSAARSQPDSHPSAYGDYYGGSKGDYCQEDDNSPASSPSQYPYSDTSSTGVLSNAQVQSRTRAQRSSPPSSAPSNRGTFDIERVERQPRNFDSEYRNPDDSSSSSSSFYDDASPTAEIDPYSPSNPTSSSTSGSAWARIRKSANSDTSPLPPNPSPSPNPPSSTTSPSADPANKHGILPSHMRQTRPQSPSARQLQQKSARDEYETSSDSFSFSREGADRQLAKEQAQKEFDQMVEAERRGYGSGIGATKGGESGGGESSWGRRRRS